MSTIKTLRKCRPDRIEGALSVTVYLSVERRGSLFADPLVPDADLFGPFRFRHDLARRPAVPRMNILNTVEQEAFDSAPVFNSSQRKHYFDFPQAIQQA